MVDFLLSYKSFTKSTDVIAEGERETHVGELLQAANSSIGRGWGSCSTSQLLADNVTTWRSRVTNERYKIDSIETDFGNRVTIIG